MFSDMIRDLPCEACEHGRIIYDGRETMSAWQDDNVFRLDDIDRLVDGIISEILVMKCMDCGSEYRYTFKELEKLFRQKLSARIFTMIAMGQIPDPGSFNHSDRVMFYCGKCTGFDGKGTCPRKVYEECKLKRLPNV